MGTFDTSAMDEAYRLSEERMGVLLDGNAPAVPRSPAPVAAPAAPVAEGPGFWSRLGSGLGAIVEAAKSTTVTVEPPRWPISGAPVPLEHRPEPPWGWILAGLAGLGLLLLLRR